MSKRNNVNPNFYYDGGRESTEGPDKGNTYAQDKAQLSQSRKGGTTEPGDANFIPGEAPVGEPGRTKSKKK